MFSVGRVGRVRNPRKKRQRLGSKKEEVKGKGAKKSLERDAFLSGPSSFPLERLLGIYEAIAVDQVRRGEKLRSVVVGWVTTLCDESYEGNYLMSLLRLVD